MSNYLAAVAALAACAFGTLAQAADGPDYDYLSAGFVHTVDPGSGYDPSHGFVLNGDWDVLGTGWLLGAGYTRQSFGYRYFGAHTVVRDDSISVGYKFELAQNVSFAARFVHNGVRDSFVYPDGTEFSESVHANGVSLELRDQVLEHLEINGGFSHLKQSIGAVDVISLGVLCPITRHFALGINADNTTEGVDTTSVSVFARFQF